MINALCFNCGTEKSAAIKLCASCGALPMSREDRIVSVCLSKDCLRQENLLIAVRYMKTKRRLPGFRSKVRFKAEQIVDDMPEEFQLSQSFDFSEAFLTDRCVLNDQV